MKLDSYKEIIFVVTAIEESANAILITPRFRVIEVGGKGEFLEVSSEIYYPPEFTNDFPVAIHVSSKSLSVV